MRKLFAAFFVVIAALCCIYFGGLCDRFDSVRIMTLGYDPGEILVKVTAVDPAAAQLANGRFGIPAVDRITADYGIKYIKPMAAGWYQLEFSEFTDVRPIIGRLSSVKEVHYAFNDMVVQLDPSELRQEEDDRCQFYDGMVFILLGPSERFDEWLPEYCEVFPNDPLFKDQWQHEVAQTNLAWHKLAGKDTAPPVVQVIDQGVDLKHEDFVFKADDKGYYGRNHCEGNPNDPSNEDPTELHATHVSGIIAAVINNKKGGCGVVPNVWMRSQRIFNEYGYTTIQTIVDGIVTAADDSEKLNQSRENKTAVNGIFNMSFGTGSRTPREIVQPIEDAIIYAEKKNCVMFAAAGNEGCEGAGYPARFRQVVGVGATSIASSREGSNDEKRAFFSNYGTGVNCCAPGHHIMSTLPDDTYSKLSGTSMACPFAAGVAAIVVSCYPQITPAQLKQVLISSGDDIKPDKKMGLRVNVLKALEMAEKMCK